MANEFPYGQAPDGWHRLQRWNGKQWIDSPGWMKRPYHEVRQHLRYGAHDYNMPTTHFRILMNNDHANDYDEGPRKSIQGEMNVNDYRDGMREVAKETRWTFFRFLPIFVTVVLFLGVLGFVTNSLGLWGSTYVERKVFEQSYQRSEALKSQLATDEAALAQIQVQLSSPDLDDTARANLLAQKAGIEVRITATKARMK